MNSVIWQPKGIYQRGDFEILLDNKFAREMLAIKLSSQVQFNINRRGKEIRQPWNKTGSCPYCFQNNSALIRQISLDAMDGVLLTLTNFSEIEKGVPLRYETHNCDNLKSQQGFLNLFDLWVENSDVYSSLDSNTQENQ